MDIYNSFSSHAMTKLLAWRNPQGQEENWMRGPRGPENRWAHAGKVVTTEIGICLLTAIALVETVAYGALALATLPLYRLTDDPCKFIARRLNSSAFTVIWGIADAIIYNPFCVNIITRESYARQWGRLFTLMPLWFPRFHLLSLEDLLEIAHQVVAAFPGQANPGGLLGPIVREGRATLERIEQGANFISSEVFKDLSEATLELVREVDPAVFSLLLTKAVYICTCGERKEDDIPEFFKPTTRVLITSLRTAISYTCGPQREAPIPAEVNQETRTLIENLRRLELELNEGSIEAIGRALTSPETLDTGVEASAAKLLLARLRDAGSGELQNSIFTTRCLQEAVSLLNAPPAEEDAAV